MTYWILCIFIVFFVRIASHVFFELAKTSDNDTVKVGFGIMALILSLGAATLAICGLHSIWFGG